MIHRSFRAALGAAVLGLGGCAGPRERIAISLDEAGVGAVAGAVRADGRIPAGARFVSIARAEPGKRAGSRPMAAVVMHDRASRSAYEALVDLGTLAVARVTARPGVQPALLEEEFVLASDLARADPRWRAAVGKRGVSDFDAVFLEGWGAGERAPGGARDGTRVMRVLSYDLRGASDAINPYARPIEGVEVLVDLDEGRVIDVVDHGVVPAPGGIGSPAPGAAPRAASPRGVRIEGDAVAWEDWRLRLEFHPRDGLILRGVGWAEGGRVRPILASASLTEMVVPYGDPSASWRWRSAFDSGEYGLGVSARPLRPGREVPEGATVLPACVVTADGGTKTIPGAVAVYERDGGLGWLHYDWLSERVESARARELWVTSLVTIGNYDYGVSWVFRQDGSIEVEALLTGILLPKGSPAAACSACEAVARGAAGEGAGDERYGTLIAPGVVAPNHQHWFSFRLDFDVDGPGNSVLELNTGSAGPGPDNPAGNAFVMTETLLRTEREAARDVSEAHHRRWRVINPSARNELGHLSGYELVPGAAGVAYAPAGSPLLHDAGFVGHHFWVTRYRPDELHAAGDYPNQSRGGEGLPAWAGDEPIVDADVVVWHSFAVTHTPRAEEWPVMSAERAGFRLRPMGFFERNPAYRAGGAGE